MNRLQLLRAAALIGLPSILAAQNPGQVPIGIDRPTIMIPIRSYAPQTVSPIRLTNSSRLYNLIRSGNLYLTVQDAIALAIENNLNLEVSRYGPLLADSALERAKAGGPLRGVPSTSAQLSSVNAGVGVNGSSQSGSGGGGGGGGGGNGSIQQVGAITPNLDPVLQNTTLFAHQSQPQANTVLSSTNALIIGTRTYNTVLQEGLLTGGTVQFLNYEQSLTENSPRDDFNPAVGPHMDLVLRQNFLRGYGVALNNRGIRIAGINTAAAREQFRSQLLDLVASVQNLYWDLAAKREELVVRQRSLIITEKFVEDTKTEIAAGALASVQLPRAEAELANRKQDVIVAQANLRQSAALLKDALSHTEDPALEAAEIIPVDHVEVPASEPLPPLRDLVDVAMKKRPDVIVSRFTDQTTELNLAGTTDPLKPNLSVRLGTSNRGVAGTPQKVGVNEYFIGGYGNALGQIIRRNFPSESMTVSFSATLGNRQAQADYGIDQLQFRQSQLRSRKDENQIAVDISSQMAALQQARARYENAHNTRILQEQLLAAEQKRSYGTQTFNFIMIDQRALVAAQLSELNARTTYGRARVALDHVLGESLEKNNITLEEGLKGQVDRPSRVPDVVEGSK